MKPQATHILKKLKSLSDPKAVEGMARFGINPEKTYGISIPTLRKLAKEIGTAHDIALELWDSGIHEARILASMVANPKKIEESLADKWVNDFDSWDVCDQVCMNLFKHTAFAYKKPTQWCKSNQEFVKRAGFALMACLAVGDKKADDKKFIAFFPLIKKEATDERNFVKKAVNWALRQVGKRNRALNKSAIEVAKNIQTIESKSAKWIANDALQELQSIAVQTRLKSQSKK